MLSPLLKKGFPAGGVQQQRSSVHRLTPVWQSHVRPSVRTNAASTQLIQVTPEQPVTIIFGEPSAAGATQYISSSASFLGSSEVPEPTAQERREIASLFDRWNAALQTGISEEVAALYAPDAILLPTVSNQVRTCFDSKVDYFDAFLQIQPYGTLEESYIRFLHPTKEIAANSGVYTFKIVKDGEESSVSARYSFIYRKVGGEWKIIEHHSSAMPEASTEDQITALFDQWNAALQTGDAEQVAALYAPDAILLPTVSNQVRIDHASRVDYFKSFLQLKPFGTINTSHIRYLSPTIAAHSGTYTFRVTRDGQESDVTARFSFVYRKFGSQWLIIEHHSSAMPEVDAQPAQPAAASNGVTNGVTNGVASAPGGGNGVAAAPAEEKSDPIKSVLKMFGFGKAN